ncbi:MAG: 30S ribosomal protein S17 [Gemmataceae bacterium]
MDKTRRVEISRVVKHRRYGKYIKNRTICYVHDENNESNMGDKVEIEECRPLSKTKCWNLIQVLVKAPVFKPAEAARQLAEEEAAHGSEEGFEDTGLEDEDDEFEDEDEEFEDEDEDQ